MRHYGFAALSVALMAFGAASAGAEPLAKPTGAYQGRILGQSVTAGKTGFSVCARMRNLNTSGLFLTDGFSQQLSRTFTDAQGLPDPKPDSPVIPGAAIAPPFPGDVTSYFVLEGDSSLENCKAYAYADFHLDAIYIQTRFSSWLKRDQKTPPMIRNSGIVRPLYSDEILLSNVCVVKPKEAQATCP